VSQHFLLSAAARTLSLAKIMRMSDEEAHATFKRIRWALTKRRDGLMIRETRDGIVVWRIA
jgi:hypothetical protein